MSEHQYLQLKAESYLRQNRIEELFEDLTSQILYYKPDNIYEFIQNQLELKDQQGFLSQKLNDEEIQNIFNLCDLTQKNSINDTSCREALKILCSSQKQSENIEKADIPKQIDFNQFKKLCEVILGHKE